ncbi:alginate lyase family protein [Streptomyces collinus]|uniref:Regulation of enolase protein 1 (Concanavalin A-like superfamily) n=1 Tax=Streptomyces collinus TaxID=42684 RepID=A0AA89Q6E3_STRCU|nr:alginate lyase family protein [Streptomyces collinus]MBB5814653.1 regulation of enolase protein 1 (concanavalin A-like superfamily) [Streptomyces collinus]WMX67650.1 alginate lyase family protein [Streptomyces collinus]
MSIPAPSRRGFLGGAAALLLASGASGLLLPSAARAAGADGITTRSFTHPGLLHSADDLARMKAAVAARETPVYDGYLALAAHARSKATYAVQNTGQITTWGRGPTNFQNQAVADSAAAYQTALMWCITGERAYADKSRDILNAWSASLTAVTGADGPLGAGLQVFTLVNAAELLQYTGYDGWTQEDIARCKESFLRVWYPAISGYMLYANGNWDLTSVQSILAIGVFCEEPTLFEDALRFAAAGAGNGGVRHRIVTDAGQGQESGRDQGHEQLAVGLLADAAQVAWNQGVDLCAFDDNRLLKNVEYAARYNLGGDVPFVPDLDRTGKYVKKSVSAVGRGNLPPIYEMAYAHYAGVRGLDAPYTKAAVFRGTGGARVVEGSNDDLPSWGTLTFAGTTAPSPDKPTAPAGVTAVGGDKSVTVTWLPPAWAESYTVLRATRADGPYEKIATGLDKPAYTDPDARAGRPSYYTVTAVNSQGTSARSAWTAAVPELPDPWKTRDIGSVRIPGSALFDGERFVLAASGTADTHRLAYLPLRGDGTITARIVYPLSSQYSKIGVAVRAGLDADAAHAAMLIQGLPLHTWSGVWSVRSMAGGAVRGTGSTPVPPSQQQTITTAAAFPISSLGDLPESATPLQAPYVEGAGDGYRLRMPYWVRVTRRGDRCTGAISPDGIRWTEVGTADVELGSTAYVGLTLTSCLGVDEEYAETGSGAFDNVSVVSRTAGEVWSVPRPATAAGDLRAVAGADAVELAWTDPDLSARYKVLRAAADGPYETIATGIGAVGFGTRVRYADATGTPGTTYHYAVAKTNCAGRGPLSEPATSTMPTPAKPQLTSAPTAFANKGEPFKHLLRASHEPIRFTADGLPDGLRVDRRTGLISGTPTETGEFKVTTTAGNAAGDATGTLTLTVGTPPPAPWTHGDLGDVILDDRAYGTLGVVAVQTPGSTAHKDGTFVVRGAGTDLTVNNQGMTGHFARRPVSGDCEVTARLVSRAGAAGDRVGLLMAKSLSPFDLAAGAIVTGGTSAQLMLRPTVAGKSTFTGNAAVTAPCLLRLERTGTHFTAAASTDDGATWTPLAEGDLPGFGDAPYYVGLVVCSRDPLARSTTEFDEVSITPM